MVEILLCYLLEAFLHYLESALMLLGVRLPDGGSENTGISKMSFHYTDYRKEFFETYFPFLRGSILSRRKIFCTDRRFIFGTVSRRRTIRLLDRQEIGEMKYLPKVTFFPGKYVEKLK